MSQPTQTPQARKLFRFSTDAWAVAAALTLAFLVRVGFIHRVPW